MKTPTKYLKTLYFMSGDIIEKIQNQIKSNQIKSIFSRFKKYKDNLYNKKYTTYKDEGYYNE